MLAMNYAVSSFHELELLVMLQLSHLRKTSLFVSASEPACKR